MEAAVVGCWLLGLPVTSEVQGGEVVEMVQVPRIFQPFCRYPSNIKQLAQLKFSRVRFDARFDRPQKLFGAKIVTWMPPASTSRSGYDNN